MLRAQVSQPAISAQAEWRLEHMPGESV